MSIYFWKTPLIDTSTISMIHFLVLDVLPTVMHDIRRSMKMRLALHVIIGLSILNFKTRESSFCWSYLYYSVNIKDIITEKNRLNTSDKLAAESEIFIWRGGRGQPSPLNMSKDIVDLFSNVMFYYEYYFSHRRYRASARMWREVSYFYLKASPAFNLLEKDERNIAFLVIEWMGR